MAIPHQVTYHGSAERHAVDALVAERVGKLEHIYPRVQHCRVVVDVPNHPHHHGHHVEVRMEVGIPGRDPIFATHQSDDGEDAEAIQRAVRDAFTSMERQLRDLHDRRLDVRHAENR